MQSKHTDRMNNNVQQQTKHIRIKFSFVYYNNMPTVLNFEHGKNVCVCGFSTPTLKHENYMFRGLS